MRSVSKALLAMAVLLPLFGQGCVVQPSTQIDVTNTTTKPQANIDAAVNASLTGADDVQRVESGADADAAVVSKDKTQLDAYTQTQIELK